MVAVDAGVVFVPFRPELPFDVPPLVADADWPLACDLWLAPVDPLLR